MIFKRGREYVHVILDFIIITKPKPNAETVGVLNKIGKEREVGIFYLKEMVKKLA